ncbi:MAG: DUF3422 domain-containing protein [Hyphomicrobiales bacterium]|nr:DUF3422 domain-containing protein [Hyphomicrobiales bacterium]
MQDRKSEAPPVPDAVAGRFRPARLRPEVLGELHARPFEALSTPRRIYHFAFLTDEAEARADRKAMGDLARALGQPPPAADAKFYRLELPRWRLRWEQHSEFTTYSWDAPAKAGPPFGEGDAGELPDEVMSRQPGDLLVAVELRLIRAPKGGVDLEGLFDPASLCVIHAAGDAARVSADFKVDGQGFTRILIENRALGDLDAGVLAQRVLEMETYRTLALLGVPAARQAAPMVRRIETELAELTRDISRAEDVAANHRLLMHLTDLAAELEALAAQTSFRFGACRAYHAIIQSRLRVVGEAAVDGHPTFSTFFARRLDPAMATCDAVDRRQESLSRKLTRTAELIRTRVQFELEEQNRGLLRSMNRRAQLQLRLQQTVEGLSVAAVSYYVVGLISYLAKGAKDLGVAVAPSLVAAASVPFVVLGVWWIVRRVRKRFARKDAGHE